MYIYIHDHILYTLTPIFTSLTRIITTHYPIPQIQATTRRRNCSERGFPVSHSSQNRNPTNNFSHSFFLLNNLGLGVCISMVFVGKFLVLLSLLPFLCFSQETSDDRPVIVKSPKFVEAQLKEWPAKEVELGCTSWRVAVEANNLSPWRTIPEECGDYVKEYMRGKGYELDLLRVSSDAGIYARSVNLSEDGKDAWVFDVDETLLSNLPYYDQHGYGYVILSSFPFFFFPQYFDAINS